MSQTSDTGFDVLGTVFSALFDAEQRGAQQTGGIIPFQPFGDFGNGIGATAEAAITALMPGVVIGSNLMDNLSKSMKSMIGVNLGGNESSPISKRLARMTKIKVASAKKYRQMVETLVRQNVARGMSQQEATKKAIEQVYKNYGVKVQGVGIPALSLAPPDALDFITNPEGFIDKLAKRNVPRFNPLLRVLSAGSDLIATGLVLSSMVNDPHIQKKGDAILIAGVDPEKRGYAWRLQGGFTKSQQEDMLLEQAMDVVARATHYVPSSRSPQPHEEVKWNIARESGKDIVEYANKQGLSVQEVLNNWDHHKQYVYNRMQQEGRTFGLTLPEWDNIVDNTWISNSLQTKIPSPGGKASRVFSPRNLLISYQLHKTRPHAWRGQHIFGSNKREDRLTMIAEGAIDLMINAAESHGDMARAYAYNEHYKQAKIRAGSLGPMDKVKWWKLKWDNYWKALGPGAFQGLLTGDFFMAASGAPLYYPWVQLNPKAHVFDLASSRRQLSNIFRGAGPNFMRDFNKMNALHSSNDFLADHSRLLQFSRLFLGKQADAKLFHIGFSYYNGIPMIPYSANKIQKSAYIAGTLHPYQLVMSFLDGSLGDRLMYIGLNFGKVQSVHDFNQLSGFQRFLFRMGLKLNSNKYYKTFRNIALHVKFVANMPNFILMGTVNRVKGLYIKGFKWVGRKVKRFVWKVGNKLVGKVSNQFLKQILTKILDFLTGGITEVAMAIYNVLNFLTGGALDQVVFKGVLYTIWVGLAWAILFMGAGSALADSLLGTNKALPAPNFQYTAYQGYAPQDVDVEKLQEMLEHEARESGYTGLLGASTVSSVGNYMGADLGISSCVVRGCISQMWCLPNSSTYHHNREAIDIADGTGGHVPVYALIDGSAHCITPGDPLSRGVICRGGNYAGNAILLRGSLPDGRAVNVWYLHIKCAFSGTKMVSAGEGLGITVNRADLGLAPRKGNDCWSGPHLHIHWTVNGKPDGKDLFCALKSGCGAVRYCLRKSTKCNVSCN